MFGLQLSSLGAAVSAAFTPFSPSSLFAASEVGAWYDPSDLSTRFQDSVGTTPVTADGQPVGLVLDKSKGLVLGSTALVNGTFDSDTTWNKAGAVTIVDGVVRYSGAGVKELYQNALSLNTWYQITFDIVRYASHFSFRVRVNGIDYDPNVAGVGNYALYVNSGASTNFNLIEFGASDYDLDNVKAQPIAGNPALAANSSSRPLKTSTGTSQWINYDAVDDVLNTTFPSALGSNCTVARANVGAAPTILTGQTIGTSYADSTDNAGLIIIDRALTGQETADVTAWLTAKGATS